MPPSIPLPEIHYLWVGGPTDNNLLSLPGHDIAGPISLCKELQKDIYKKKNIIKFWCLEKYRHYYQMLFSEYHVVIEVCTIEQLIFNTEIEKSYPLVQKLISNFRKISQTEEINMGDLINFKDQFSLFLLMNQPGYFFDTNVFPAKKRTPLNLCHLTKFTTAQSSETKSNDVYLMYSPGGDLPELKIIFERRLTSSYLQLSEAFKNLSITQLDHHALGVQKFSYRSYMQSNIPNFYRLLALDDFGIFKEHCQYADINRQDVCLFSQKILAACSVCWTDKNLILEEIKELPISTDFAYVAGVTPLYHINGENPSKVYFYNKKKDTFFLVYDESSATRLCPFPRCTSAYEKIAIGKPKQIYCLVDFFSKQYPDAPHPPTLINIEGGTLLHHAIICEDIRKVAWLIRVGARLDLKATYRLKPYASDPPVTYTPVELAEYLGLNKIKQLLQNSKDQVFASSGGFFPPASSMDQILLDSRQIRENWFR